MASFTDQIPTFNPYISQLPVDAMVKVGMEKQRRYDEGVQKIQTEIDKIGGLSVAKDVHKAYLQSKINELGSNLKTFMASDFSDYQLVNSVAGMTNQITKDPIVLNAVKSTQVIEKGNQDKEAAIKAGKSSVENEWFWGKQVNDFLDNDDLKQSFNGKFIEFTDVDKKLRDIADKIKDVDSSIDIPYKRDNAGNTLYFKKDGSVSTDPNSGGTAQIDDVMLKIKTKGTPAEKILNNFYDSINENDKRQLRITADYHYRNLTPVGIQNEIIQGYNNKREIYSQAVVNYAVALETNEYSAEKRAAMQSKLNEYQQLLNGLDSQMEQDLSKVETESGSSDYKYKVYTQKYLTNLAKDLENLSVEKSFVENPAFNAYMKRQEYNFKVQRANIEDSQWQQEQALRVRAQLYQETKDARDEAKNDFVVTPGGIRTDVETIGLKKVEADGEILKQQKNSLNKDYGDILFPNLPKNQRQAALEQVYKNYATDPKKPLTANQREYLNKRFALETQITDNLNLHKEALKAGAKKDKEIADAFKQEKTGISVNGQFFSAKDLYSFAKELDKMAVVVGTESTTTGPGSTVVRDKYGIKGKSLEKYKGTKFEKLATAYAKGYNLQAENMSPQDKIIYGKILALKNKYDTVIGKKVKEQQKLQSDYIMSHSPEYQTQEGTISPNNEQDMGRVTQLLTLKAGQFAKYGALDSDNPKDYDPDTVMAIRESKTAGYTLSKNFDGSGTLIVTNGRDVQKVPLTQLELATYFPRAAKTNIVSGMKSAIMASPNKTTNLMGTMDPVNARYSGRAIPGLVGTNIEDKVRMDVIGGPYNNGSETDKFQVVLYYNSSKGWITKVVNSSEYATEQGVSNIINNISTYTINTMLK